MHKCWWCNGWLQKVTNGPRKGLLAFKLIEVGGVPRQVHVCCAETAKSFSMVMAPDPDRIPTDGHRVDPHPRQP